ncbi:MAG: hypothetical protein HC889_14135 [Synechococcaceae cyanobacterium SM1_2_3]|nr:hypothetical protein [Synechococcaceae cyanobacterium SM1_2_3]
MATAVGELSGEKAERLAHIEALFGTAALAAPVADSIQADVTAIHQEK